MSNLNYSRELYLYSKKALSNYSGLTNTSLITKTESFESISKLHHQSVKFTLPAGGRFENFKSGSMEIDGELRLPFKCICLEYKSASDGRKDNEPYMYLEGVPQYVEGETTVVPKRLVYAVDTGELIDITVAYAAYVEKYKIYVWTILPVISVNKVTGVYTYPKVMVVPYSDYADELGALFLFLKALSCANVKSTKMSPSVTGKANLKRNGYIPYDTYHVLTIDLNNSDVPGVEGNKCGTHASPREHLRRGHIRTLASGKTVWVNDTVVNKGAPNVVVKDYAVA